MADRTGKQGTTQQMGGKGNQSHGGAMADAKQSAGKVKTGKTKGY